MFNVRLVRTFVGLSDFGARARAQCICEDAPEPVTACSDLSFEAHGTIRKMFGIEVGESCADVLRANLSVIGGPSPAETCSLNFADFAADIRGPMNLASGRSYTPPSSHTHLADLCPGSCGGHGIGASACGGTGSISTFTPEDAYTTTTATLRTRLANAP